MEEQEYLTVPEAVALLGSTDSSIRTAMRQGRLPFIVKYGRKLIARADLDAYKQRTRPNGEKPRGRPPGAKNKPKEKDAP